MGDVKSDVRIIAETMKQGFANMNIILGILVLITVLLKFV